MRMFCRKAIALMAFTRIVTLVPFSPMLHKVPKVLALTAGVFAVGVIVFTSLKTIALPGQLVSGDSTPEDAQQSAMQEAAAATTGGTSGGSTGGASGGSTGGTSGGGITNNNGNRNGCSGGIYTMGRSPTIVQAGIADCAAKATALTTSINTANTNDCKLTSHPGICTPIPRCNAVGIPTITIGQGSVTVLTAVRQQNGKFICTFGVKPATCGMTTVCA